MDTGQLVWIIVAIVVILAVLAVVLYFSRKRTLDQHREQAAELRQNAQENELGARESEARAMRAEADAKQAEVEAERLRSEARERAEEAETVRSRSDDQLREADALDPDTDVRGRGGDTSGEQYDSARHAAEGARQRAMSYDPDDTPTRHDAGDPDDGASCRRRPDTGDRPAQTRANRGPLTPLNLTPFQGKPVRCLPQHRGVGASGTGFP